MLEQTIAHIIQFTEIIEGYDFDEAATKQFVVLPILRALGWDDSNLDTLEVFPEQKAGNGSVDYALQLDEKPLVFIECKRWRVKIDTDESQKQIARYVFQNGIDLAVLTNGKTWEFYLSYKTHVPWKERKFCSIDLEKQREAVSDFEKYLSKSNVIEGRAKAAAESVVQPRVEPIGIQNWDTNRPYPPRYYRLPILNALVELGGSAPADDVLARVYLLVKERLRQIDESPKSDADEEQLHREYQTLVMQKRLVAAGLMTGDSPQGTWEITQKGREYLKTR